MGSRTTEAKHRARNVYNRDAELSPEFHDGLGVLPTDPRSSIRFHGMIVTFFIRGDKKAFVYEWRGYEDDSYVLLSSDAGMRDYLPQIVPEGRQRDMLLSPAL